MQTISPGHPLYQTTAADELQATPCAGLRWSQKRENCIRALTLRNSEHNAFAALTVPGIPDGLNPRGILAKIGCW
jgi:hypothetical protein